MAQLGARLDGIEEVVGSNPIGSTIVNVASPRTLLKRFLASLVLTLVILYLGDYASFRVRMMHPKSADPLESIRALRVLAIPEKNGKISYEVDQVNPEQTVKCVHSIFPHAGYSPCWYVKPRINRPIPM